MASPLTTCRVGASRFSREFCVGFHISEGKETMRRAVNYSLYSVLRSTALLFLVGVIFLGCSENPTAPSSPAADVGVKPQGGTSGALLTATRHTPGPGTTGRATLHPQNQSGVRGRITFTDNGSTMLTVSTTQLPTNIVGRSGVYVPLSKFKTCPSYRGRAYQVLSSQQHATSAAGDEGAVGVQPQGGTSSSSAVAKPLLRRSFSSWVS